MNLPNPPTDNLYKFVAIFGMVLVVAPLVLFFGRAGELRARSAEVRREVALLGFDVDVARQDQERSKEPDEPLKTRALRRRMVEAQARTTELSDLLEELERLANVAKISAAAGLVLTIVGFTLWYERVQRFEDLVLRRQVEAAAGPSTSAAVGEAPMQATATELPNQEPHSSSPLLTPGPKSEDRHA